MDVPTAGADVLQVPLLAAAAAPNAAAAGVEAGRRQAAAEKEHRDMILCLLVWSLLLGAAAWCAIQELRSVGLFGHQSAVGMKAEGDAMQARGGGGDPGAMFSAHPVRARLWLFSMMTMPRTTALVSWMVDRQILYHLYARSDEAQASIPHDASTEPHGGQPSPPLYEPSALFWFEGLFFPHTRVMLCIYDHETTHLTEDLPYLGHENTRMVEELPYYLAGLVSTVADTLISWGLVSLWVQGKRAECRHYIVLFYIADLPLALARVVGLGALSYIVPWNIFCLLAVCLPALMGYANLQLVRREMRQTGNWGENAMYFLWRRVATLRHQKPRAVHWPPPLAVGPGLEGAVANAPQCYCCPITHELMLQPAMGRTGVSYEKDAILHWLTTHESDPFSNDWLAPGDVFPNLALRSAIELYLDGLVPLVQDGGQPPVV